MRVILFLLSSFMLFLGCYETQFKWTEYEYPEGNFKIDLPNTPEEKTYQIETELGLSDLHFFIVEKDNYWFTVSYSQFPDSMLPYVSKATLIGEVTYGLEISQEAKIIKEKISDYRGFPCVTFIANSDDFKNNLYGKHILVNNTQYVLHSFSEGNASEPSEFQRYMESFELIDLPEQIKPEFTWQEYYSPDSSYTAKFIGDPIYKKGTRDFQNHKLNIFSWGFFKGAAAMKIDEVYCDDISFSDTSMANKVCDYFAESLEGKIIKSKYKNVGEYKVREIVTKDPNLDTRGYFRIYYFENKLLILACSEPPDKWFNDMHEKYFDSFKFVKN